MSNEMRTIVLEVITNYLTLSWG